MHSINEVWDRLSQVRTLVFETNSRSPTGWSGRGEGQVAVETTGQGVMTFIESGSWYPAHGSVLRFRNVFRWSKIEPDSRLKLEHLRFGAGHPVYLFDLMPNEDGLWLSVSPHTCREDCYTAHLAVHDDHVEVGWAIRGPIKDEVISYAYS